MRGEKKNFLHDCNMQPWLRTIEFSRQMSSKYLSNDRYLRFCVHGLFVFTHLLIYSKRAALTLYWVLGIERYYGTFTLKNLIVKGFFFLSLKNTKFHMHDQYFGQFFCSLVCLFCFLLIYLGILKPWPKLSPDEGEKR